MRIEILSAEIKPKLPHLPSRWVAFKDGADLSELDAARICRWVFESRACNVETLIATGEKVTVPQSSPSFGLSYNLAFAEVHVEKLEGPIAAEGAPDPAPKSFVTAPEPVVYDKPSRVYLMTIPSAILAAYVSRADPSRPVTSEEIDGLKKPKPSDAPSS